MAAPRRKKAASATAKQPAPRPKRAATRQPTARPKRSAAKAKGTRKPKAGILTTFAQFVAKKASGLVKRKPARARRKSKKRA